ncbi:hypothetical protein QJS10_CPB17g01036 [Acorus calamus]|uniref:Plant heme peroxidase family profile domain-containing protein n=1 Tax=Acorus calamus TaxID=4465 RepID=A0AAV9CZ14_ACOCL|nr:hypothetical protein QJS10_CPB17g01036 [Acorus calamus]
MVVLLLLRFVRREQGGLPRSSLFYNGCPNRLDNSYYKNLQIQRGLFFSDQILWHDPATKNTVGALANNTGIWEAKFTAAMIRLGSIDVKIGDDGEVRKNCRVVN